MVLLATLAAVAALDIALVAVVLFRRSRVAGPIWGCPYCHNRFGRARELADHEQRFHPGGVS